jgi:predicted Rossmann fold nucleotide-binding protein DprA/Smf involved in DNA uptake
MKNKHKQSTEDLMAFYTAANLQRYNRGQKNSFFHFMQERFHLKIEKLLEYSEKQLLELDFPEELLDLFFDIRLQHKRFHKEFTELLESGIAMLFSSSIHYPNKLRERIAPKNLPPVIYCKGNIKLLAKELAAIVSIQKSSKKKNIETRALLNNLQNRDMALLCGVSSETDKLAIEFALQRHLPLLVLLPRGILANGFLPLELRKPTLPDNILMLSFFSPYQKSSENNELTRLKLMHSLAERSYIMEIRRDSLSWEAATQALIDKRNLLVVENERKTDTQTSLYIRGAGIIDSDLNYHFQESFPTLLKAYLSKQKASLGKIRKHFDLSISPDFLKKDLAAIPEIYTEKRGERLYYRTENEILDQLTLFD